jgi:hypothetical protein
MFHLHPSLRNGMCCTAARSAKGITRYRPRARKWPTAGSFAAARIAKASAGAGHAAAAGWFSLPDRFWGDCMDYLLAVAAVDIVIVVSVVLLVLLAGLRSRD